MTGASMSERWRLIDTGLRPAAQNIALDRALLEARRADEIPSTLRFARYPLCALIGSQHAVEQELDADYCGSAGISIQRRVTAGDLMCFDPAQLSWELVLHRRDVGGVDLQSIARRLNHAAAAGLSALGVDARYRPRGDIEVNGRSVCVGAGVFDGTALLYQGALLLDADPAELARASRLARGAPGSARDRQASLKDLLGARPETGAVKRYLAEAFESEFDVEFSEGELTLSENARFKQALREIDHPDWVQMVSRTAAALPLLAARHPVQGGVLLATVAYDAPARAIRQAWFGGDVVLRPRRALADLEAALAGTPANRVAQRVERFFAGSGASAAPLGPADFVRVVQRAIGRLLPAGIDERNEL
jgi:lipoate-protein ligase A